MGHIYSTEKHEIRGRGKGVPYPEQSFAAVDAGGLEVFNRRKNGEGKIMGRQTGLEPATLGTTIRCSAVELLPPFVRIIS